MTTTLLLAIALWLFCSMSTFEVSKLSALKLGNRDRISVMRGRYTYVAQHILNLSNDWKMLLCKAIVVDLCDKGVMHLRRAIVSVLAHSRAL